MGADGGSIPKRIELVRTKARPPNTETAKQSKLECWKYCALSKELLQAPVVTCKLGRLYNKESILKFLLDRKSFPEAETAHIKGLKDLVTLNMTPNQSFKQNDTVRSTQTTDAGASPFICPVTGKEMNGNFPFVYLKRCGCVLSEQALREISVESCLKCGKKRTAGDVVELNPRKSDIERKRPAEVPAKVLIDDSEETPYLPSERGYRPSLSGLATFRKTAAIDSLYKK
ncbi:hypothetical protein PSACC_00807 [Paramicrosporidium saccamoebae]|uniref:Uncharacterized protein n=1 Tax=Paramicrosporidium saccamoebae TaxID=1246581 RepID=A0A2H9TNP6_9FUNG|nr:hypothetical protein PSACC_00807 [Paramicrosporidium saccamoebae]